METADAKILTDDMHLYVMFKDGEVIDEYDFLAILDEIENKDDREALLLFLDQNVPIANKTYWILRGIVRLNMTFWEEKRKKGVKKSTKQMNQSVVTL